MATLNRPSILVADDDPRNLLAFEILLDGIDADIRLVASGDDALRELLKGRYDVVLLDVNMPGLDGFATARLIRARPMPPRILFVSAQDDPRGEPGAPDYFRKPLDPVLFRQRLSAELGRLQDAVEPARL